MSLTQLEERTAAVVGGVARWATEVDWSNDGGHTWTGSSFRGGNVTCASTSQIRWTSQVKLAEVPFGLDGINPYQTRYRIRHGLRLSDHEKVRWGRLGMYALTDISRSTSNEDEVALSGSSFETYLIRSAFTNPRTVKGFTAERLVTSLIRAVLPDAIISWSDKLDGGLLLPNIILERDRWGTIDGASDAISVAKSLGARIFPDEYGVWRVEPVPTLQDEPAWEAFSGPGGVLLKQDEALSSEGVENVQIVYGSPSGGSLIGPGIAKDNDAMSLTYVGRNPDQGGFGEVPSETYTSQLITSRAQAQTVAESRLASRLGLKQQITFDSLHDPTKRPGQVGIIHGFQPMRAILDSVTYDLSSSPGPLQCQTRTTATRLTGYTFDPAVDAA